MLFLILIANPTFTIEYKGEELLTSLRIFFVKIKITPKKEPSYGHSMSTKKAEKIKRKLKKKAQKKRDKKAKKNAEKKAKKLEPKKEKKSITIGEILDILDLAKGILGKLRKKFLGHIKIKITRLRINIATGDAASTAIAYGAATQAVNLLFPVMEKTKNFKLPKKDKLHIGIDYTSDACEFDLKISVSVRVFRLFHFAFSSIGNLIKYFFKRMERKSEDDQTPPSHKYKNKNSSTTKKGI